jgi:hypothetical protein
MAGRLSEKMNHKPLSWDNVKLKTDHKKIVEVALNLKAVFSVDDKEHQFVSQVVLHLRFDSTPLNPGDEDWEPEVTILNARDMDEIMAPGTGVAMHAGKGHHGGMKTITKHYGGSAGTRNSRQQLTPLYAEASFIKSLNLRNYPFDAQTLTIVLVGDEYSLLCHMMDRREDGEPLLVEDNKTHPHRYS